MNVDYTAALLFSCPLLLFSTWLRWATKAQDEGCWFILSQGMDLLIKIYYIINNFSSVLCATLCYPMTYSHWNQFFIVAYICMCISYVTKLSFRLQHHVFPYFQCFARFILLMKVPWVSVKSMHEWLWLISIFWNIFRTNILLRFFPLWITIVMKSNRIPE